MSKGKIVIYGGRGCLGSKCVEHFKNKNWWVANVDLFINDQADINVKVPFLSSWLEQEKLVVEGMGEALRSDKVDAVICVAGGWAGGNATKNLTKKTDLMWKQSVWSSTIAASLATKYLSRGGLLVLTGAKAALNGTPNMIGYGMAKAAVHQLTKSLGCEGSGLPKNACVVAILPETLDTVVNRKWTIKKDSTQARTQENWTPISFVVSLLDTWVNGVDRPPNGSLVTILTAECISRINILKEETNSDM